MEWHKENYKKLELSDFLKKYIIYGYHLHFTDFLLDLKLEAGVLFFNRNTVLFYIRPTISLKKVLYMQPLTYVFDYINTYHKNVIWRITRMKPVTWRLQYLIDE